MTTTTYTIRNRVVKTTWVRDHDDEDIYANLTALTIDGVEIKGIEGVNYIYANIDEHDNKTSDAAALPCMPDYGDMDDDNNRGVVGYGDYAAVRKDFADMCLATVEAYETWKATGKVVDFYTPPGGGQPLHRTAQET